MPSSPRALPSVDRLLREPRIVSLIERHGRPTVTAAIRNALDLARRDMLAHAGAIGDRQLLDRIALAVASQSAPALRPVFNLTGTVLHTNLGRAPLPIEAIEAVATAASQPTNLEFDLEAGVRGDRDAHVESILCRLTGAEAATVVNNNAAAVLLVLNTLALRKEVPTSRGELIEIGGSFRMPDIMARSGCKLREVGTTNRVHLHDYADAIGSKTGVVLKVHTSNYEVVGFTSNVSEQDLAVLCRERGVPLVVDLGSGSLVDLTQYGLPHEPTPSDTLARGAALVTFSGDKLLGGPQAGVIAGRQDLVDAIKRNPLRRALRVDKMTVAALAAVLAIYLDPARLPERLPALILLTRPLTDIRAAAERLLPHVSAAVASVAAVRTTQCGSQVGSGALPTRTLPSAGLAVQPTARRGVGRALRAISSAFRRLPVPVIGRIQENAFILDVRCLQDEDQFVDQLRYLNLQQG